MIGGLGNDVYLVDAAGDRATEASGGGADRVLTKVSYVLAAGSHVEFLSTSSGAGTAAINLTGNDLANSLIGNAGANRLDGLGGNDRLTGLGGNDTYVVDRAGDRITEAVGGGADKVLASVSYTLAAGAHVEALSTTSSAGTAVIHLAGNPVANRITGNAAGSPISQAPTIQSCSTRLFSGRSPTAS